jgi:hypothetical protein
MPNPPETSQPDPCHSSDTAPQVQVHKRVAMSAFVSSGYITVDDALNLIGRELFALGWTDDEHKARTGLLSEDEWSKIKHLTPPRGGGAPGNGPRLQVSKVQPKTAVTPHRTGDPSDPVYQAEYLAGERYAEASRQLRVRLESGQLEAAILDPWSGTLHRAPASLWRQHNADRMIATGEAPLPHSSNTGELLLKRFADASVPVKKPMPNAKIAEAIELLKTKTETESLTRPQQAEFVRNTFPNYRVRERQLDEIFRSVPVPIGRPRKSNKKV